MYNRVCFLWNKNSGVWLDELGYKEFSVYIRLWTSVGEKFNKDKHPAGTEIKAITYSNMNVKKMLVIDR